MPIELQWEVEGDAGGLEDLLSRVADICMELEGVRGATFAVRVVDDETIRALNRDMRGVDKSTDVLSFPNLRFPAGTTAGDDPRRLRRAYDPYLKAVDLGSCALNIRRAREQAAEYGHAVERELAYLTAHSAFHLMGYDHMTEKDKRAMREMEKRAMSKLRLWREPKGEITVTHRQLLDLACEVQANAYAPYSNFHVGAAILTEDGRVFVGCNFENASLGAGICAERCATGAALAAGQRRFLAVAVAADELAWPCGICRQVLREFACDLDMPIIACKVGSETYAVKSLGELLPESFGPEDVLGRKA